MMTDLLTKHKLGACIRLIDMDAMKRTFLRCVPSAEGVPVRGAAADEVAEEVDVGCTSSEDLAIYQRER